VSRQSTQTADIEESTVVSDKQSLPQHPDGDMNTTVSAIWNTSEGRHDSIRSWVTPGKEDTVSEEKRGSRAFEGGGRNNEIMFHKHRGLTE
jgi:hypothetical protein